MFQGIKLYSFFLFFFISLTISVFAHTTGHIERPETPITFSENKGQWDDKILFRANLDGGLLFLERNCLTYAFYDKETLRKQHGQKDTSVSAPSALIKKHAFRINFLYSDPNTEATGFHAYDDIENYYIGNEKKWKSGIKKYGKVFYDDLYKNIDAEFIGKQNSLKYNFIIKPGGNASNIQLKYDGLSNIRLSSGNLILSTSLTEIVEQKPYAYQLIKGRHKKVDCEFYLDSNVVKFKLGNYDRSLVLIIDPVLIFSSFSGSYSDNFGMTATYDSFGNFYSGGTAFNIGYPTTVGAYDTTYSGPVSDGWTDVVITKYNSIGTKRLYSTYLGGDNGSEIVTSLIVNDKNELYLYGATSSSSFPTTANAFDRTFNGGDQIYFSANGTFFQAGTDIYVSRLSPDGRSLLSSTFIGGNKNDGINYLFYNYGDQYRGEIILDKEGNCYFASSSRSSNFPVINGFDKTLNGLQDAIVVKFNPSLSNVLWSSYLGGDNNDWGNAIAVDDSANVYITGGTISSNFPTSSGSIYPTRPGGPSDGYITKISSKGDSIISSSYIGTDAYDQSYFIQLDKYNNVYLTGQSLGDFPSQTGNNYTIGSQFISKLKNDFSSFIFSTRFGNNTSQTLSPSAFLVDNCGNIYFSGWGGNIVSNYDTLLHMPLTPDAFIGESDTLDGYNFYLARFSKDAKTLEYGTYFGGRHSHEHVDGGTSRFDKTGIVYQSVCAGCWGNSDFPTTAGVVSRDNLSKGSDGLGKCNNGIFKFDFGLKLTSASFVTQQQSCTGQKIKFENTSNTFKKVLWDFGGNDTTSEVSPERTFMKAGKYTVKLIVSDTSTCNLADTTFKNITIQETPKADFNYAITPCTSEINVTDKSATNSNPIASFNWYSNNIISGHSSNLKIAFPEPDTVIISLKITDNNGCSDSTGKSIIIPQYLSTLVETTPITCADLCDGKASASATGGSSPYTYAWKSGKTGQIVTGLCAGNDTLIVTDALGCFSKTSFAIYNPDAISVSLIPNEAYCSAQCFGKATSIVTGGTKPYKYLWNDSKKQVTKDAISLCPGSYSLLVNDSNNCSATSTTTIQSSDRKPLLSVSADDTVIFRGLKTNLHATKSQGYSHKWTPAETLNDPVSSDPVASPLTTTTYYVEIADSNTCTNRDSITIYIKDVLCAEPEIFIPTGFTPNGDKNNDILYVRGYTIQEMYLAIYNRWGEKIFESTSPDNGWDGFYKGERVTPAVYAYYLKVKCINHQEFFKKGNITLIR